MASDRADLVIDAEGLQAEVARLFRPVLAALERAPEGLAHQIGYRILSLVEGGGLDVRVESCPATSGASHLVCRLGFAGELELLIAAVLAGEFERVHGSFLSNS